MRHGGSGPPLLLLHGNPQTHAMWHLVAPVLAKRFTVICPDLRGYGFSLKPPATSDHAPYAKMEMAKDMMAVMDHASRQNGSSVVKKVASTPRLKQATWKVEPTV